ncbi:MAG TPA: hypothetical protein VMB81_20290, partial [Candidatus Sulfotelmatobacter sp.]|nr:hypothetical protein [Candidatus Sulfotelmatobacter sp.]
MIVPLTATACRRPASKRPQRANCTALDRFAAPRSGNLPDGSAPVAANACLESDDSRRGSEALAAGGCRGLKPLAAGACRGLKPLAAGACRGLKPLAAGA